MSAKHQVDDLRKVTGRATTRLDGHELYREGKSYSPTHYGARPMVGVGACSCGATSEPLDSNAKRQRWHREHKLAVIAARLNPKT